MTIAPETLTDAAAKLGWDLVDQCPICDSGDYVPVVVGRADCILCECRGCGAVYLNPRPSRSRERSGYAPDHVEREYLPRLVELGILSADYQPNDEALYNRYRKVVDLTLGLEPSGPVVDIGCSIGLSMLALRTKGIEVIGYDVDEPFVEAARRLFDLDVRQVDVFDPGQVERFDIAVANAVLEHIDRPVPFLEAIRQNALRPGGALVITVPNLASTELLDPGPGRWSNITGGHLWYPTEATLASVAVRAGFTVETVHVPPVRRQYRDHIDFYIRGVLGYEGNISGGIGMVLRAE